MNWAELEAAAPEIARLGSERLAQPRVALLGTLRANGSPRISPVEPFLTQGHLLFGAMSRSSKTRDLRRDSRACSTAPSPARIWARASSSSMGVRPRPTTAP
jgi:Pyridoxamine 5'-phosphate oxidase